MTQLRKKAVQHEFFSVPKQRITLVSADACTAGRIWQVQDRSSDQTIMSEHG